MLTSATRQAGDTIIEVLSAVVIFSFLAVMTIAVMNRGIAGAQQALEVTLVRQEMAAQAEALRYVNQAYVSDVSELSVHEGELSGLWKEIRGKATSASSAFTSNVQSCPDIPSAAFVLDTHQLKVSDKIESISKSATPPPYAQVSYDGGSFTSYGIWVEAVSEPAAANIGYIDFHINGCWQGTGSGPVTTLGTIVRVYDPQD